MQNNKTRFIGARDFKGHLGAMRASSPFPDAARADIGADGKTRGMPLKTAHDADDSDLAECCKNGSLEHLKRAQNAIGREIQRCGGMVRFAK